MSAQISKGEPVSSEFVMVQLDAIDISRVDSKDTSEDPNTHTVP